jgi:hypothetical protein
MAIEVTAVTRESGDDAPDLCPVEWDVGEVGLAPEQARNVALSQSVETALFVKITPKKPRLDMKLLRNPGSSWQKVGRA